MRNKREIIIVFENTLTMTLALFILALLKTKFNFGQVNYIFIVKTIPFLLLLNIGFIIFSKRTRW